MRRLALIVLALASPILLIAMLIGGETGGWLFVVTGPLVPVALMALADVPPRQRGFHAVWLASWLASLELGSAGMMWLAGRSAAETGLPPSTVIMLVALGLVPLLLVPLGHAVLFPRGTVARSGGRAPGQSLDR